MKPRWARLPALAAALAAAPLPGPAAPELAPPFQDHAVLQADRPVSVWGRASAGEHVSVAFAGQTVGATAGADGRWIAVLSPLAAAAAGSELSATGNGRSVGRDVLVGEVWLCAGGPGLEAPAGAPERRPEGAAAAHGPPIRRFVAARRALAAPTGEETAAWESALPQQSGATIAFARALAARLGSPVGLLECPWADAPVEAWMSPAALARFPPAQPSGAIAPGSLFLGMVQPLLPYSLRGVLWFQGAGDLGRPADFAARFPAMIGAWRSHLGQGDIPFYWVQLPGRRAPAGTRGLCAAFREAQSRSLSVPATGEAVAIDEAVDGPEIGRRLSLIAKAGAYSIPDDYSGPAFAGMQAEGPVIRVRFSGAGEGLTASARPLQSFEVAGADRVFHAASAAIDGGTVVVRSAAVPRPVAVRYAWSDAPDANLYNGAGLPAAPFRSDDW